jgi:hypothetical protein
MGEINVIPNALGIPKTVLNDVPSVSIGVFENEILSQLPQRGYLLFHVCFIMLISIEQEEYRP